MTKAHEKKFLGLKLFSCEKSSVAQLLARHTEPIMNQAMLTAPVPRATQKKVRDVAKAHNVPIRVLCAMLIERGLADLETGKLEVTKPSIKPA